MISYSSKNNGWFHVQESPSFKDFNKKIFVIWEDPYAEYELIIVDDDEKYPGLPPDGEFLTHNDALNFLTNMFGELQLINLV